MTADPPTRIPCGNGAEYDVFTGWRRALCYTRRPGVCRKVKRGYNRRLRAVARRALRGADA